MFLDKSIHPLNLTAAHFFRHQYLEQSPSNPLRRLVFMATAPINNIAATFASVPASSSLVNKTEAFAPPSKRNSISSTSWNLHTSLPRSSKSYLLKIYGRPGPHPLPLHSSAALHSHHRHQIIKHRPLSVFTGQKLPSVAFSYLDHPSNKLRTLKLSSLCSRAKRVVLIGAMAAFSPSCTQYVKRVESMKSETTDLILCVAVNNVYVMRAWGEFLGIDGNRMIMLSDEGGVLFNALGIRSPKRFCFSVFNGVITNIEFDDDHSNDFRPASSFSSNGLVS